jgi:hypothetical protein
MKLITYTNVSLILLFLFMSISLGYPVLNRFDSTKLDALSDTVKYLEIVENGLSAVSHDPYGRSTRLLMPMMAHVIFQLAPNLGSWDMIAFSMLMVNSIFCSLTSFLIFRLGLMISNSSFIGITASFLYLLNFSVSNLYLVGLVDAGFGFIFTFLGYVLLKKKWGWLPLISVIGTLIKEVFLPLGVIFIVGWILSEWYRTKVLVKSHVFIMFLFALISFIIVTALKSYTFDELVFPWQQMSDIKGAGSYTGKHLFLTIVRFLYVFIWLLPLAIPSIWRLPRNWLGAMFFAIITTVFLGWWASISGVGYGRGIFNVASAGFCIAAAYTLRELLNNTQIGEKIK